MRLLEMEVRDDVDKIVLTPHFNCETETIAEFRQKRRRGVLDLAEKLRKSRVEVEFKLGAEIYFSPELPNLDLHDLCCSGTDLLLIELPVTYNPGWTRDILFELQLQGYRILLAHVERYPYVLEHPDLLYELVNAGIYAHMNAPSLLHKGNEAKMIRKLIDCNLVHTLASDAHSVHRRPVKLAEAYEQLDHWFGSAMVRRMQTNADALFAGREPRLLGEPTQPRAGFHLFGN